jgi:hypothetical protein
METKPDKCKYAFFSEKQALGTGRVSIYRDENDNEFIVTEVGKSPVSSSKWDDLVRLPTVGLLTYVKEIRRSIKPSKAPEDLILLYGSLSKPLPKYSS